MLDLGGYGPIAAGRHVADHRDGRCCRWWSRSCLGVVGALAKTSKSAAAQTVAGVYTTLIRGVPDLVLMLLIFFGGQMLVNQMRRIGRLRGIYRGQRRSPPACSRSASSTAPT